MTEYIVKTNKEEADKIVKGDRRFMFRRGKYYLGDMICFNVIQNMRKIPHPIDRMKFVVTDHEAIADNIEVTGFREVRGC